MLRFMTQYTKYTTYTNFELCHTHHHKTLIIFNLKCLKIWIFEKFERFGHVFFYCWCVLYQKVIFSMRLSDSARFLYIWTYFKDAFQIFEKCPDVWTTFVRNVYFPLKIVYILVFSEGNITFIFGGNCYWYGRLVGWPRSV